MRWKLLALALVAASLGSLIASLSNRTQTTMLEGGWTSYVPLDANPDTAVVEETYDAFEWITFWDPVLWLGLAIGFAAAAVAVAVGAFWPRR